MIGNYLKLLKRHCCQKCNLSHKIKQTILGYSCRIVRIMDPGHWIDGIKWSHPILVNMYNGLESLSPLIIHRLHLHMFVSVILDDWVPWPIVFNPTDTMLTCIMGPCIFLNHLPSASSFIVWSLQHTIANLSSVSLSVMLFTTWPFTFAAWYCIAGNP